METPNRSHSFFSEGDGLVRLPLAAGECLEELVLNNPVERAVMRQGTPRCH